MQQEKKEFKPNFLDRAVSFVSPIAGAKRLIARKALHEFRYDGAKFTRSRPMVPTNQSPNDSRQQRDRYQIIWEAREMADNFPLIGSLNRKYAQNVAPNGYQATTGDKGLDKVVEQYLNEVFFKNVDFYGRYNFYQKAQFAVIGANLDGDYGWALVRDEDRLKIQSVEADLIGNPNETNVTQELVGGIHLDEFGRILSYEVWRRENASSLFIFEKNVEKENFIHFIDPLQGNEYRGFSRIAPAIPTVKDLKETLDALRMAAKKHASITLIFTGSNGAQTGAGEYDPFIQAGQDGRSAYYERTEPGKNYYLNDKEDAKSFESHQPSGETQYLIEYLTDLIIQCYGLPRSYAIDASKVGGVSARLEKEMASIEFRRARAVYEPGFTKVKNLGLLEGVTKGHFGPVKASVLEVITKGRWTYMATPQPDIGKEATAMATLLGKNIISPIAAIIEQEGDPETVIDDYAKIAAMKKEAAEKYGVTEQEAFAPATSAPVSDVQEAIKMPTPEEQAELNGSRLNGKV
jgi:hypothetical protein